MPTPPTPPAASTSGESIDTGTGGFPIDGIRQAYDPGATDSPDSPPVMWSPGAVKVDQEVKDISKGTKRTLASYLSRTTMGKTPSSPNGQANAYPIVDDPGADPLPVALSDVHGGVPSLGAVPPNQPHFVDVQPGDGRSPAARDLKLSRGRTTKPDQSFVDGNQLLSDVKLTSDDRGNRSLAESSTLSAYTNSPAIANNRFGPRTETYAPNPAPSDGEYAASDVERKMGSVTNQGYYYSAYTPGSNSPLPGSKRLTYGMLAQVGTGLMLRAAGEPGGTNGNPASRTEELASIVPGSAQLGVQKIDQLAMTFDDVVAHLPDDASIDERNLIDPVGKSWGSLNDAHDQFSGMSNYGMQLLALALLAALTVAISAMGWVISRSPPTLGDISQRDPLQRRPFGAFRVDDHAGDNASLAGLLSGAFNFWSAVGIPATVNNTGACIIVGALAFFGVNLPNANFGVPASALQAVKPVSQSPGYYAVMARTIVRSFWTMGDQFSSIYSSPQNLLNIFSVLRDSKFMRSLGVFSQLGDRIIMGSWASSGELDASSRGRPRHISDIDMRENVNAMQRSRIKVTDPKEGEKPEDPLTLSWATHRSPDLLLMPPSFLRAMTSTARQALNMPTYNFDAPSRGKGIEFYQDKSGRIPTKERERIEDALEAEYMPFYFLDVRTNEIVSFHAFLASLSDDYSAAYDSTDAYGRVEPVKGYKGTQRKIGLSFYVVSTSEKDFDFMWSKVNKLTTMVYPQFTEGRLLDDGNGNQIYAPFSQQIAAAPMVRLRLGDLIKTNYSKFNLARIFGYSYDGTSFTTPIPVESMTADDINKMNTQQPNVGERFFLSPDTSVTEPSNAEKGWLGAKVASVAPSGKLKPDMKLPDCFVLELVDVDRSDKDNPTYKCLIVDARDDDGAGKISPEMKADANRYKGDDPSLNIYNKIFWFGGRALIPTQSTIYKRFSKFTNQSKYDDNAVAFMDEKNNTITKSFKSVGGKGLAGFIESMGFDWFDRVTWELGNGSNDNVPGRRAPKMCKVTISFSPIHDITPGLDHVGANRAPIYPVGPFYSPDFNPQSKK